MELKKMPGLAGGPDIKQKPSHPKPGTRLWRGSLPQCPPTPEEGWVLGRWGHAGLTFDITPFPYSVFQAGLGWAGSLIPSLLLKEVAMDWRP